MLKPADIPRFAKLGLTASIQPQHAMDDRDVITRFWANPGGIPYAFKALHDAGVRLRMGSDAPVAPLDPWMAISAAVFGTESSDREPFQPEQCLDARTALAASTAVGRDRPEPGDPADWCSWTATRMLSPRRRRCGDAGGGDHARRPLDVLLFARRMIPDKERMRIPHTNPIGNRPLRRQGVRRHTAMTYR